jgi:hypothetical protein
LERHCSRETKKTTKNPTSRGCDPPAEYRLPQIIAAAFLARHAVIARTPFHRTFPEAFDQGDAENLCV